MYKLTHQATDDFASIYDYTLLNFGEVQADLYTDALETFFDTLADMPTMGRSYLAVTGVMQIEFQRHTLFYTVRDRDILIVRILHQHMNHPHHLG